VVDVAKSYSAMPLPASTAAACSLERIQRSAGASSAVGGSGPGT